MPHLESKTKLIMTASVNKYINPKIKTTTKTITRLTAKTIKTILK